MNFDECVEFCSLKILFVACLSLIIEPGISCDERGGDNGCSTRITEEGVTVLLELILGIFDKDDCCSLIKFIGTNDDVEYCSC